MLGEKCRNLQIGILAILIAGAAPAFAGKQKTAQTQDYSVLSSAGPFQGLDPKILDPTTALLIGQLSKRPELMNVEYLKHYLGNPDPQITQIGARTYVHYWYDHLRRKRCELYQEYSQPKQIVESVMVFHLPQNELDFALLDKKLGAPVRRFYDHEAHQTRMYTTAPYTTLSMSIPHTGYAVNKATVTYMGPSLSSPGFDDMQIAQDHFKSRTQFALKSEANWRDALAKAQERMTLFPQEAESHLALAHALRKTGNVHEAINEYKLALNMGKFNEGLRQQCIDGLKELRVLPREYSEGRNTGIAGLSPGF